MQSRVNAGEDNQRIVQLSPVTHFSSQKHPGAAHFCAKDIKNLLKSL